MDRHGKLPGWVSRAAACFPVHFDEGAEAMRFSADDGDRQRKSQRAGACKRLWCAADTDPRGQRILDGPRKDALPGQRRAMLAGPVDVGILTNLEEQLKFFRKKRVVIVEIEAEQRIRLDEGAAANHNLGPSLRDEIQGGEVLEDADRVVRAQDGDGAGQADTLGTRGRSGENHGRRGGYEFLAVVFADAENIQADLVGELDFFEKIAHTLGGTNSHTRYRVRSCFDKAVYANLHIEP